VKIDSREQPVTEFRLGVLGAGRLASAIAKLWLERTREKPLVWSLSGQRPDGNAAERVAGGVWVADWSETLKAQSVVVAIPGRALLDLVEPNPLARTFKGNIFSAAVSLSRESLQRVFPLATITCIAPFLIDDTKAIPMLALRSPELTDVQWAQAKSKLENFGDIDVVHDDDLFARVSLLGAPWPVVVVAAIQAASQIGVQGLQDETAIGIGQRLFLRAVQALLTNRSIGSAEQESSADVVATPGGITERGLRNIEEFSGLLAAVFDQMQARANELRA
jgi:pyrroline-5-carboxylate reductase